MEIIKSDGSIKMKWFIFFMLAPGIPAIPIIGYMDYMINYEQSPYYKKQIAELRGLA